MWPWHGGSLVLGPGALLFPHWKVRIRIPIGSEQLWRFKAIGTCHLLQGHKLLLLLLFPLSPPPYPMAPELLRAPWPAEDGPPSLLAPLSVLS